MVFIKKVNNSDAGDADHVGGNDWDALDNYFDDTTITGTAKINTATYFRDQKLQLRNPANTFTGTWVNPAFTANVNLELQDFGHYMIYKTGSNIKALNLGTRAVEQTNTDAYTAIQAVLTGLTSGTGAKMYINAGAYSLSNTLIPVQNSAVHIEGEAQNGFSNLIAAGNFPAIQIFGSWNTLENLYLSHAQGTYSTGLLNITGGTDNVFKSLKFEDSLLRRAGSSAIRLDNTAASIYRNHFDQIAIAGFDSAISANVQNFSTASHFINKNDFTGLIANAPNRILQITGETNSHFDNNNFVNCYMQSYASTECGWDYETGHSGRALYSVHQACFIDDLPVAANYALLGSSTQLYLDGCYPAWDLGGVGATNTHVKTNDFYTSQRGLSTQSGNGTTKIFNIAHGLAAAPSNARVTAGSSDAQGTPAITFDATNVIITYPIAPPSGSSNLIWNWEANVF